MAKKKDNTDQPEEGVLTAAAKAVGKAAGKVAALAGAGGETPAAEASPAEPKKTTKVPKLAPKNKSRLPRREKKARQKAAARQQA